MPRTLNTGGCTVECHRPRIEGLFARIERWRATMSGDVHWRATGKDNVTSSYGQTNNSRIYDPGDADSEHPSRIFTWLLDTTYDDRGNVITYEYKREDQVGIADSLHEQNRKPGANRQLKRIKYGNQSPYYPNATTPQAVPLPTAWHFQVVFDYGDHDLKKPQVAPKHHIVESSGCLFQLPRGL